MPFSLDPEARPHAEQTIKRSRFIARLGRADGEEDATGFIALARELDRGAGHHCFAYVIGDEVESCIERYSDDGEPSGTAGAPILHVLKARDLVNVVAVVSRYYGGIKLGAGGLARAYSGTVVSAIDTTTLRTRVQSQVLRRRGFDVDGVDYGQQAVITVLCVEATRLQSVVAEITSGRGELVSVGHVWR
jgi:uncharacterized YigZ family protein